MMLKREELLPSLIFKNNKEAVVEIDSDFGTGTGLIITTDGVIITNNHVVGGAHFVKVKLQEKEEVEGRVIKSLKYKDISFIKINKKKLQYATLGSNKEVLEGNTVYAIGNPYDFENTFTKGMVSSANREIKNNKYIQTDTAINPGNSGGPLFNSYGEVIGINTMTYAKGLGLGFALQIDEIKDVFKEIKKIIPNLDKYFYCDVCGNMQQSTIYCENCGVALNTGG